MVHTDNARHTQSADGAADTSVPEPSDADADEANAGAGCAGGANADAGYDGDDGVLGAACGVDEP